jgi:hypothetical protein
MNTRNSENADRFRLAILSIVLLMQVVVLGSMMAPVNGQEVQEAEQSQNLLCARLANAMSINDYGDVVVSFPSLDARCILVHLEPVEFVETASRGLIERLIGEIQPDWQFLPVPSTG